MQSKALSVPLSWFPTVNVCSVYYFLEKKEKSWVLSWTQGTESWQVKERSEVMDRRTDWQAEGMVKSFLLSCPDWSESSLEFGNIRDLVVSTSPRLTFLMQDWGIQRSVPLKFLVGVRREAARLLKTVCDIDIKTRHIEWCQLKFHSVPFGKLGSWACQCEMNNETSLTLLIFYLMWNSPLLRPEASQEQVITYNWHRVKRKQSRSSFISAWNHPWRWYD